ncbi:hypothetical protein HMPREF1373_02989, partial [Enterococcus faecium P1140]
IYLHKIIDAPCFKVSRENVVIYLNFYQKEMNTFNYLNLENG